MSEHEPEETHFMLGWNEAVLTLFKHKKKILFCMSAGLVAAAASYLLIPPIYKSEAKLFVPYVVERNGVDAAEEATATSRANDAIINSEVEILTSWDLALKTAKSVLHGSPASVMGNDAVASEMTGDIVERIEVSVEKGMNVITVSYKDHNPEQATQFLRELLKNYREKHLEVHRFPQALDIITARRDEVRKHLDRTEEELKQLKNQVQGLSVADSTANLSTAIGKAQLDLNTAEAERRGQEARVAALESLVPFPAMTLTVERSAGMRPTNQESERHRFLVQLLSELKERERALLATYPADSRMVKIPRRQISELEQQRREMEERFPGLALIDPMSGNSMEQSSLVSETARLAALKASEEVLRNQLHELQGRREQFADLAPHIARLELDKQVLEASYKNLETNLGKAQDDRAVDWSKVSNIASVQEPSPAVLEKDPLKRKLTLGFTLSGLALGLGVAFFRETTLERKVKRSREFEERLSIPLLLSIPMAPVKRMRPAIGGPRSGTAHLRSTAPSRALAPHATNHFIRPFCERIRDRIIVSFELRNLDHKPKLIGVTGFTKGAGSSTLAGGLAAALSETGDGKVLLIDMNAEDGGAHPFFGGAAAPSLSSILDNDIAPPSAADNLYLATVDTNSTKRVRMGLRRFNSLVPQLRAAEFDYIIFDIPPLDSTSISLGVAGFLDKLLLVVEAERTDRDAVKRTYSELVASGADVSCILNKTRSYGPKWLEE